MGQAIWEEFLKIVRQEAGSRVVDTWFKAVSLRQWDSLKKIVYLKAPNRFVKDWIQGHYTALIQLQLERLLNVTHLKVVLETEAKDASLQATTATANEPRFIAAKKAFATKSKESGSINTTYTFDNFVVGPNNALAYASAKAVTETPGRLYNPLFFYGDSGLGKTHLLHAIGNALKADYKKIEVLYQTADRFVGEFISAIRFDKVHHFKSKYKRIDVLLIDDIQFISNKDQTQEAFFHIFNSLYEAHKQIIFSSDSVPQDIAGLAERLRSRLASGLVADLRLPPIETKIAILKRKAEVNSEVLSDEVAHFIASSVVHNVRELEGLLIRVIAFASLMQQPITLELAQKVVEQVKTTKRTYSQIRFNTILKVLRKHYAYTLDELVAPSRNKDISFVRQVAMYLMKELTEKSLRDIGIFLGRRNHSTVLHAINKIKRSMETDTMLEKKLKAIKQEIRSVQ